MLDWCAGAVRFFRIAAFEGTATAADFVEVASPAAMAAAWVFVDAAEFVSGEAAFVVATRAVRAVDALEMDVGRNWMGSKLDRLAFDIVLFFFF